VIEDLAIRFVREVGDDGPFLLYLTPFGPHGPTTPAPGDAGSWHGPEAVASPSVGERDVSDKPGYIRELRPSSADALADHVRVANETLTSVDRMVGHVVQALEDEGVLDRTLLVFTSDNGLSLGEHRWRYKLAPYEESIRVPLIVRYDPVTAPHAGTTSDALVANVDIVPTIAELAGVRYRGVGTVDGRSLVPLLSGGATTIRKDVLLEHLDYPSRHPVPTYCGVRTTRWLFVRYVTGERELYDLVRDPYELRNLASTRLDIVPRLLRRTRELCAPAPPGYTWG
jgi:arylsulfatase A-like enzyme